jgi:hypothetical protein
MLLKQWLAFTPFRQDSNFGRFSCFLARRNIDVKNFGAKLHGLVISVSATIVAQNENKKRLDFASLVPSIQRVYIPLISTVKGMHRCHPRRVKGGR